MPIIPTPALSPLKLERLLLGEVLLDGVVNALDDHVAKSRPLQQVGHRGGVAKRIHRPTAARLHTWTKRSSLQRQCVKRRRYQREDMKRRGGDMNPGVAGSTGVPRSADPTERSSESLLRRPSPSRPSPAPAAPPSPG